MVEYVSNCEYMCLSSFLIVVNYDDVYLDIVTGLKYILCCMVLIYMCAVC